ncbi:MAG: AAA family ATPase [Magnetococcales bacterium]|nr:AAA family ATPase [Magnetococcales bacterium]
MITRLIIKHYKSIEHLDLKLGPINILVGPNGSGKSNVVDALKFVRDALRFGLDRAVSDRHGIDTIRQWTPRGAKQVSFEVHVKNDFLQGGLKFSLGSFKGDYSVIKEEGFLLAQSVGFELDYEFPCDGFVEFFRDKKGTIKSSNSEITDRYILRDKSDLFFNLHVGPFSALHGSLVRCDTYSIFPNTLRAPQNPSNDKQLNSDGSNLTSIFKMMPKLDSGKEAKQEIISALQRIMPSLEAIRIQSLGGMMVPVFRVRESDGKGHDFQVSQLSDGTLRVLGLLTALYQPEKTGTIALEEPEQTVHPGVLAVIADAIKEVSDQTQIIVTTHSPDLVDHFDPEHIHAVEMVDGVTKVGPINQAQVDAVRNRLFSLGELMSREGLYSE